MAKITSAPARPSCRCCGKRLRKATCKVWNPDKDYLSKADLQSALPQGSIIVTCRMTSSKWIHDPVTHRGSYVQLPQPVVESYSTWDGKSYGLCFRVDIKTDDKALYATPGLCSTACLRKYAAAAAAAFPDFTMVKSDA